jgi:integrase/recombinase XerD
MSRHCNVDTDRIGKFRRWLEENNFSNNSIPVYLTVIRHFDTYIRHFRRLDEDVIRFFLDSSDAEYSSVDVPFKYRKKPISRYVLRTFFDSINREELRLKVKKPRRTMRPKEVKRVVLSEQKIKELFKLAGGCVTGDELEDLEYNSPTLEKQLIVRLLYEGAIRVGELCPRESNKRRKVSHIDFKNRALEVIGKGGIINNVYFKPTTARLLKKYIIENSLSKEDFLFPNENPWKVWKWLTIFSDKFLRKRINPHVLRRSCLTHMIQNGATLKATQDYARHIDPKTTSLYIILAGKERKEAGEKFVPEL